MTWTYTINGVSADFVPVTLPNGNPGHEIRFPVEYVNMDVGEIDIGRFTGDRDADIAEAKRILREEMDISSEKIRGYAVHHCMESGKMILVDKDIHKRFSHYGGHYHNNNL